MSWAPAPDLGSFALNLRVRLLSFCAYDRNKEGLKCPYFPLVSCVFQNVPREVPQRSLTVMGKDAKQALLSSHDEEVEVSLGEGFVAEITVGLREPQLAQIKVDTKRNDVLTLHKS